MGLTLTYDASASTCLSLTGMTNVSNQNIMINGTESSTTKDLEYDRNEFFTSADSQSHCYAWCGVQQITNDAVQYLGPYDLSTYYNCDVGKTAYIGKSNSQSFDQVTSAWQQTKMTSASFRCSGSKFSIDNDETTTQASCWCGQQIDNVYMGLNNDLSPKITVNLTSIHSTKVKVRCFQQNKHTHNIDSMAETNEFTISTSCNPDIVGPIKSTNNTQIKEKGSECIWNVPFSSVCSKSGLTGIKAYVSKTDLTTPVSNEYTVSKSTWWASNEFYYKDSKWQFTGLTLSTIPVYADLKFYAQATYSDGTTNWLSDDQLSLYCDSCIDTNITVNSACSDGCYHILEQAQGNNTVEDAVELFKSNFRTIGNYPSLCKFEYLEAFSDLNGTVSWSDANITLSAADEIKPQSLRPSSTISKQTFTVNTTASMKKEVYIKASNTGKNSGIGKIIVIVCGAESWSLSNSSDYTLLLPKSNGYQDISNTEIASWFTWNNHSDSHQDCLNFKKIIVCAVQPVNGACSQEWNETSLVWVSPTKDRLKIYQDTPFYRDIYYLMTYNAGATSVYRKITITICGSETIVFNSTKCAATPWLYRIYEKKQSTSEQIEFEQFDCFNSSSADCPIAGYDIVQSLNYNSSGQVTAIQNNSNSKLTLDSSYNVNLNIDTSMVYSTYYIRIYTNTTLDNYAQNLFVPLYFFVYDCSEQTISFVDESNKITIKVDQHSALPTPVSVFEYFVSSESSCPITSFSITSIKENGNYKHLSFFSMGTSTDSSSSSYWHNLIISSTSTPGDFQIFIQASNGQATSNSGIYLAQVTIVAAPEYEVIEVNIPPEFEGTLPSTIEIDLMESDRGEILIPGYKDFNGDNVTLHVSELPFQSLKTLN